MTQDLTELVQISDMLKERALAEHRKNVQESQRVAQEIEQIDTLRQQALRDENSLMARRNSARITACLVFMGCDDV